MTADFLEEKFAIIIPNLHTRGLRKALDTIESFIVDLEQELESTKNCNLNVEEKQLENIRYQPSKEHL